MKYLVLALLIFVVGVGPLLGELRVPAFTAYLEPDPEGAALAQDSGITHWTNRAETVNWFGEIKAAGKLACAVELRLAAGKSSRLRLAVAGQSHEATAAGAGDAAVTISFGDYDIAQAGYRRFTLESLNASGADSGNVKTLVLGGPAAENAHFNLDPRRNAASVHLAYVVPEAKDIRAFYAEATGIDTPVWTYIMACGWNRGYFGMQVNSSTERHIIFSVWDSGKEKVDRNKVPAEERTQLVAKGDGVQAGDFGNEGTGGHSHLLYPWKTGEKQRFLITAQKMDETHTVYSGYFFRPDLRRWTLISSWKAPKSGAWLKGLYSFSEDFVGSNGELRRKALYGNQWVCGTAGDWTEITTAHFSHDPTGNADRLDRFAGVEGSQFFLSHGGFIPGTMAQGEKIERPANGQPPADVAAFLQTLR